MVKGDDVRIAGVKVGSVEKIEVVDRTRALVTFTVEEDTELNESTHAAIRYRNLVGQRYISLTQEVGDAEALDEGDTIPVEQTSPALDLTVLFNGFKPLFQALSPDDINKLSYEIVQVFQGEGGTLESLLGHTASITQTLADRDQVIGDLIDNLDYVLDHVADRDDQLSSLITSFRTLVGGPQGRPRGDPDLARRHLGAVRADRRPDQGHPAVVRRRTSSSCAGSPATSTATRPSSTARSRCCRSSSRRSAGPRSTVPGSTSTCASSRAT